MGPWVGLQPDGLATWKHPMMIFQVVNLVMAWSRLPVGRSGYSLTVRRNRLISLLVEVQPMELLVHHCSASERRLGNQGS